MVLVFEFDVGCVGRCQEQADILYADFSFSASGDMECIFRRYRHPSIGFSHRSRAAGVIESDERCDRSRRWLVLSFECLLFECSGD